MTFEVVHGDVLKFVEGYSGPKFHGLLADPPYHLTSIVTRFSDGEPGHTKTGQDILKRSTPMARLARGFLGKSWDGGDIAFRPETWQAISSVLYPGALMMCYAGSRTYHRMATAMEDSGLIIHPAIGWVRATGLPKGTRIDTQVFRHPKGSSEQAEAWAGHKYNAQALKPALEFVAVAQVPFGQKPIDDLLQNGAGAYNLAAGSLTASHKPDFPVGHERTAFDQTWKPRTADPNPDTRVPANFVVVHTPDCQMKRVEEVRPTQLGLFGETLIAPGASVYIQWSCVPGCPVERMTQEAGRADSIGEFFFQGHWAYEQLEALSEAMPAGYAPRASRAEGEAGLELLELKPYDKVYGTMQNKRPHTLETYEYESDPIRNTHPTRKPIAFNRWLASLLLPPKSYAPRRIFTPFCGVGSEMIGGLLAGWEKTVGVELEAEYVPIAQERLKFWTEQDRAQLEMFDA